ncbi:MAG TPA: hypothetical protein DD640_03360 [Clostridiales bacterium]|nr:hypothetical protein [Clostridiales bacterium]
MGNGCAYLYRSDVLYPLTQDDFPLEAIDYNGKPVPSIDVYCAGVAGTVRYSNIAQLQPDDCIIVCNKDVMDALGQREVLRMLYDAEDQADAAGLIMTAASAKLPGVPLQFLIGFVESISAAERGSRIPVSRYQAEAPAPLSTAPPRSSLAGSGEIIDAPAAKDPPAELHRDAELLGAANADVFEPEPAVIKPRDTVSRPDSRLAREEIYEDDDGYGYENEKSGQGRRIAFYVVIAIICVGCLFAIYQLLFSGRGEPKQTTAPISTTTAKLTPTETTAPSATSSESETGTSATTTIPTTTMQIEDEYTVVSGDTLYGIAIKFYGSGSQTNIDLIKTANELTSDNLQVGQVLKIPAKP